MQFWLPLPIVGDDYRQFCDIARYAEQLGFAGVAVTDHVVVPMHHGSPHPAGGETPFDHRPPLPIR